MLVLRPGTGSIRQDRGCRECAGQEEESGSGAGERRAGARLAPRSKSVCRHDCYAPDRGFPAFVRKKTWLTSAQGANQQRTPSGHPGRVTGCDTFRAPVCRVAEPRDSKCGLARNLEPLTYDYSITQLVRQAEVSRFFARPAMLGFWMRRLDRIANKHSGKRRYHPLNPDHPLNPAPRQG